MRSAGIAAACDGVGMERLALRIARDVGRETLANAAMAVPAVRARRLKRPRAGERFDGTPQMLERYAFQALRGVEGAAGSIAGRDVVEFGPGDTLSAGLAMLAAGASSHTALDRFVPDYSSDGCRAWYHGVRAGWDAAFPGRPWPDDLDPARFPDAYGDRVVTLDASLVNLRDIGRFDIVTSWQVGEHVLDIERFARETALLLRAGGVAIQRVDFGPHSWQSYDDPLLMLRFPALAWRAMGSNRGVPNRLRHDDFLRAWDAAGLAVTCQDMHRFDASAIDFDKLGRRFRATPRAALLVRDVVYVCRHRDAASGDDPASAARDAPAPEQTA